MQRLRSRRALITILGAIGLGVLGNAIWELLLKPAIILLTDFGLNVATLGMTSLRDDLYLRIARGDQTSLSMFSLATSLVAPTFLIIAIYVSKFVMRDIRTSVERYIPRPPKPQPSWVRSVRRLKYLMMMMIFIGGVIGVTFMLDLVRTAFISNGVHYLAQAQTIVAPFMDDGARLTLASDVARMKTRGDFNIVNAKLQAAAKNHDISLPAFTPF